MKQEKNGETLPDINSDATQAGRVSFPQSDSYPALPSQIGQYEIKEKIGVGGMGEVYAAYDVVLKRPVALKLLYGNNPGLIRRFLQEARGQAQIEHESVCKVFAAGEQHGRNYIAMQLINGKTLSQIYPELDLNQKLQVMAQAAEAVDAAHKIGLIHRDIKPANIMVEKKEGTLKPYVLDFGLAREKEAPKVTMTGIVMGTPQYMSPEQADERGNQLDARTDVYSLGATLYEILTSRTVFEGQTGTEILLKVLQQEPRSLRAYNPKLPSDVETIVMKCLEKDPARRYQTANALAQDLRRYLQHEPILAKPIGFASRARKKIQKHKTATLILTLFLLTTITLLGLLIWMQWKARLQAKYAVQFANEIRFNEATLRSAFSAPLHDMRPQLKQVRSRLANLEKRIEQEGKFAYGPGYDALGNGFLLLRDYEKAKHYLTKAWSSGYHEPSTAYALGKTYGFLYQQGLSRADKLSGKSLQVQEKKRAQSRYGKPAITYLNLAKDNIESTLYVESLIALYEGKYAEALQKAKRSYAQVSWPYELKKLEGDIYMAMGREQAAIGNNEETIRNFQKAGKLYGEAIELARSAEEVYLADADHWISLHLAKGSVGQAVDYEMRNAVEACDRAYRTNPESVNASLCKPHVYLRYGVDEMYRSSPTTRENLLKSATLYEKTSSYWPNSSQAFTLAGTAYLRLAEYDAAAGIDPQPSLKAAIMNSEKALKLDRQNAEAYYNLAGALYYQGDYELIHGKNPMHSLAKVIDIFNSKLEGGSGIDYDQNLLGLTYLDMGLYHLQRGDDPVRDLKKAIEHYETGLKMNPDAFAMRSNLGLAHMYLAKNEMDHGRDPMKNFKEAQKAYDLSLSTNENLSNTHNNKANILLLQSEYEILRKKNPINTLNAALDSCNEALKISPEQPYPHGNCALAHVLRAKYEITNHADPGSFLEKAEAYLNDAVKIDPQSSDLFRIQAEANLISARWLIAQNKPPQTVLTKAKRSAEQSIHLNQFEVAGYRCRAEAERLESDWLIKNRKAADLSIQDGLKWITEGKKQNPKDAELMAIEGTLYLLASKQSSGTTETKVNADKAIQALQHAFEINPFLRTQFQPEFEQAQNTLLRLQ